MVIRAMLSVRAGAESLVDELAWMLEPLRFGGRRRPLLALVESAGQFECYRTDKRQPVLLAKGDLHELVRAKLPSDLLSQPVEVRLDGSRVLSRTLQLPAASRQYLDAIVSHQMERMTPWSADRVVFDYVLDQETPAGAGQLSVRLIATSRDVFDNTVERLAQVGIRPAIVGTSEDPLDQPSAVNLFRAGKNVRRQALRRAVSIALATIAFAGVASSGLGAWRLYTVNAEAAALQDEMSVARNGIENAVSGMALLESRGKLLAQKRDVAPMVIVLDRLSSLIPTSTYLTELAVEGEEIRISGLSSDAPALIGILEGADLLSDVQFAAPTTREDTVAQDRFVIVARLASTIPAEPDAATP